MVLEVKVYADADPIHTAYVFTGLCDLAYQNEIQLQFVYPWTRHSRKPPPGTHLWLEVEDVETGQVRRVCFDYSDKSNVFDVNRLKLCDMYLKRSYYQPDVDKLQPELRNRVVPLGLIYACRSSHDRAPIQRALGYYFAHKLMARQPLGSVQSLYTTLGYLKRYFQSPVVSGFEASPDQDAIPTVLYQTRLFDQTSDETGVNEWRVSIIRALREALGDRFVGGLIPTDFAKEHYPDLLSTHGTERKSFVAMIKRSLIAVYTRGVHHSIAWKFGEYLAAAKCVVAEPPRNKLPVALEQGKHYLPFTSPEECVEACARLLENPQLASEMRVNNYNYYRAEVVPSTRVFKCLTHAFDRPSK